MPIIGLLIIVWILRAAIEDARGTSPAGGGDRNASPRLGRYGFFDHLRDAYRDHWMRRTDALVAARNARPSKPGWRARWRARRQAARAVINQPTNPAPAVTAPTAPTEPVVQAPAAPDTTAEPAAAVDPVAVEPTTASADEPVPATAEPTTDTDSATAEEETAATEPPATGSATGGTPMSAPTGEAVNFETALQTIDDMIAGVQATIDAAEVAASSLNTAKANVDAMQTSYAPTSTAAGTKMDHEAAASLDSTTMGHAATTVDALPVGACDSFYEEVEQMEAAVTAAKGRAEVALASLEAERAHLIATYGDAHETVAGNLSGNAGFLDSSGTAAAPAPAAAAA